MSKTARSRRSLYDSLVPGGEGRGWMWAIPAALLVGAAAGMGGFTFRYAQGLSYLSTDPRACANCHIMQRELDSWQKSSHHTAAVCVDCHLPSDFVAKYVAKAEAGMRHSEKFTTQKFVEPIVVPAAGQRVLQDNCVRCHGDLAHAIAGSANDARNDLGCTHCHFGVGHGERAGLGAPLGALRPEELERPMRSNGGTP